MIYEYYKAALSLKWTCIQTHNCAHEQQTYDDMSYNKYETSVIWVNTKGTYNISFVLSRVYAFSIWNTGYIFERIKDCVGYKLPWIVLWCGCERVAFWYSTKIQHTYIL